jgi:MFS family permease
VLVCGLWSILCAGLHYSFSTYSEQLKEDLGLTQQQVTILALGKDIGAYLLAVQGLVYDAYGPRVVLGVGGCLMLLGYGSLFVLTNLNHAGSLLWPAFFVLMIASNGGSWVDMTVVVTLLHNASAERTLCAGISKSLLGLGASVFTALYVAFLRPHARSYLLLCAIMPFCVTTASLSFFRKLPRPPLFLASRNPARARRLSYVATWVLSLCIYLFILFLLNVFYFARAGESKASLRGLAIALLLLLLLPPSALAMQAVREARVERQSAVSTSAALAEALLRDSPADELPADEAPADEPPMLRGQTSCSLSVAACLRTPEFVLLFYVLTCGTGAALVLVNNLGQLTKSLRCLSADPLVSLFSICSALGRVTTGWLGLRFPSAPRPLYLAVALSALSAAMLSLAFASCDLLYAACALTGLCFGCLFTVAPLMAGELFGAERQGALYGFAGASPAIGSFFLNTLVTGRVYTRHAQPDALDPGKPSSCFGGLCFRTTFVVSASACASGALVALVLLQRTRHLYVRRWVQRKPADEGIASPLLPTLEDSLGCTL